MISVGAAWKGSHAEQVGGEWGARERCEAGELALGAGSAGDRRDAAPAAGSFALNTIAGMSSVPVPNLTWPMLLAKWTDFARASVAFPTSGEGGRWRSAVAPIIGLQAVACALAEMDQLPAVERPLAHDRAEVLIRQYAGQLEAIWHGEPMPARLADLLHDARRALVASRSRGVE